MMKHLSLFMISIITLALTACAVDEEIASRQTDTSSDETLEWVKDDPDYGESVQVTIDFGATDTNESGTRASTAPNTAIDYDSSDTSKNVYYEGMFTYCVVAVNNSDGTIADVQYGDCSSSEYAEKAITFDLTVGAVYNFYNFANIDVNEIVTGSEGNWSWAKEGTPDSWTWTVAGNDFDVTTNHIPMSNKQPKLTVVTLSDGSYGLVNTSEEQVSHLWTVRMLAKITVRIYNEIGADYTLESITLSNITPNVEDNVYLMPTNVLGTADGDDYCAPHIATSEKEDYTYYFNNGEGVEATDGSTHVFSFYVNESAIADDSAVAYFTLTLNGESDKRYAVANNWNEIARNDWHYVPIILDDYKLDLIPYDYTAIGVYPTSVKEEDGVYTITFHDTTHFHIVPVMTKLTTGEELEMTTVDEQESGKWAVTSTDTEGNIALTLLSTTNANLFCESTDLYDNDDNGGAPVWDSEKGFFFGKFKDGEEGTACLQIKGTVYKGESASREYTYTVYLIREEQ